jgi:tRNA modification GTPase
MTAKPNDTIAAIATPPGSGAIAVLRLSGPHALELARSLTGVEPRPRHAVLCAFRDAAGNEIDRGLLLFFPAPKSSTGEHVVELQCHGGRVVSDLLLARALELGARAAEPGEFTQRAFLNGKLDLLQAEAVADLIASGSAHAARAALRSLEGGFSTGVRALQERLTRLRVLAEAWLDFPEEELGAPPDLKPELEALAADIKALAARAEQGTVLRDGLTVVIAGPPNAGKSSLLNRLAGYEAAIVTDIPGTTRDLLREHLAIDGIPLHAIDTAGFRDSSDPVEREGVKRARTEVARADCVLWIADAREPRAAALAAARTAAGATPLTFVRNKIDLTAEPAALAAGEGFVEIAMSVLTGEGMQALVAHLKQRAGATAEVAGTFSARRRHVEALARVVRHVSAARGVEAGALELAAEELRAAQLALSELTGEHSSDDLLGEIFGSFCIGK